MTTDRELARTDATPSALERALGVITEVEAGEAPTALLLTLNVFLLLCAYYVIKPVREGLILAMPNGAEYKSYLSAAIAMALLFFVPAYGAVADRVAKHKLVVGVTLFFASHLLLFYALAHSSLQASLGVAFFIWVGVFSMAIVSQFWSFANQLYTDEQGKRLFVLIAVGASLGGVAGSFVTKVLVKALGTYPLMLVAAAILVLCAILTQVTAVREAARTISSAPAASPTKAAVDGKKEDNRGTFSLVLRHRYLTDIAIFSVIFTCVNTNGEFMLGTVVSDTAHGMFDKAHSAEARDFVTGFYGDFFLYVNILVFVVQTFVVSRLVKFGGLRFTFFILPVIALLDAIGIAAAPVLGMVRVGKIAENSTDYSVNNSVRAMLWLPTTTEMKYKAKLAIDAFCIRIGDVASAGCVWLGAHELGWSVRGIALTNLVLVGFWILIARSIVRGNAKMTADSRARAVAVSPAA